MDKPENKWVNVKERLPEHKQKVIINIHGNIQVAIFYKGRTKEECKLFRQWGFADEDGNNLVPYRWSADGGPMDWFGQEVSHWMQLPNLPVLGE